ncbi:MAG: UvrD-helicase domain-containing protein [Thermoanaerobaculia bacterium]
MTQAPLVFDSGRRNLFIEAGAGTGKTTRIVREGLRILLDDPAQAPDRIVLITFTEKAAGEIAERIRDALVDLRASFESGTPGWPSGASRKVLAVPAGKTDAWRSACDRHIEQLDRLRSQTIHSFCQTILAQFPFEAGVDPSFRIVEGFERARLIDDVWLAWVAEETGGEPEREQAREWETALEHLESVEQIRYLVVDLMERRAGIFDAEIRLGTFTDIEPLAREAVLQVRAVPEPVVERIGDEAVLRILRHLRDASTVPSGRDAWIRWLAPVAPWLRTANLPRKKEFDELTGPLRVLRGADKADNLYDLLAGDAAAEAIVNLARRFIERIDVEKERRGVLDFDDLLIRTARLLEDAGLAKQLRRRFDFLFVDEFQDTDRLQARIVERLAQDDAGNLAPGRVVLVGDPKQSIYSFRRADPETYRAMLDKFVAAGAETPKLTEQYRSDPALVDALNTMFAELFSLASDEEVYRPGYTDLVAGLTPGGSESRAHVRILRAHPEGETSSEKEATAIASWLQRRAREGGRLDEVAILLRKMTDVEPILEALDRAGVPYVLPRDASILERRTAIDLLAVLRAIAMPFDRGAEVSAARGPYFALTDTEIAAESVRFLSRAPFDPDSPWGRFRATLASWRRGARTASILETVEAILAESEIETVQRLFRHSGPALADLDAFRELAREFDREVGGSLALFVEEMLRRRDARSAGEPAILDDREPGVRILTVHASKGLEFGTVILPNLAASTAGDGLAAFTLNTTGRLYLKGNVTTAGTLFPVTGNRRPTDVQKERNEAEVDRLFYVAVTRARHDVVFVVDPDAVPRQSFYKPFLRIFGFDPKGMNAHFPQEPGEREDVRAVGGRDVRLAFELAPPPSAAAIAPQRLVEPRIATLPREDRVEDKTEGPSADRGELIARAAGLRQRSAGILLHRVLEVWDGSPDSLDPLVGRIVAEAGADSKAAELVRRRLASIQRSPTFARLRGAELVAREMTIHVPGPGGLSEGRIDRLVRSDGRWTAVDYKSGRSSKTRLERDRIQIRGYCDAVRDLTGEACDGLLWYIDIDGDEAVEV